MADGFILYLSSDVKGEFSIKAWLFMALVVHKYCGKSKYLVLTGC